MALYPGNSVYFGGFVRSQRTGRDPRPTLAIAQEVWRPDKIAACPEPFADRSAGTRCQRMKQFILTLEGVNKSFEGFKAINDLNFYLDEGELRVIIGPNGAGKSTMLDLITGRTRPDSGKIEFGRDTDLTRLNEYQINRLGIGRKFQTPAVYVEHTVFENIWLSLEGTRSVWSTLFSRATPAQRERIEQILELIGLA